jgi:hypothetical protein
MPGRSLRVVTLLLAPAILGCAPAPSPSPPVTPPPVPADFVPFPDLVWEVADLPPRPNQATGEEVSAISATDAMFVAVGYREAAGVRDGIVWRSTDGQDWAAIAPPLFAGVELIDVTPAPGGFEAIGVAGTDGDPDHPAAAIFQSSDGSSWQPLPALSSTGDTYPVAIAGGPAGVIAVADDVAGGLAVWRAADGRDFQRVALAGPAAEGLVDPQAVADGFVALGADSGPPTLLSSPDGMAWTASPIDPTSNATGTDVVVGRWGTVVQAMRPGECDSTCADEFFAWWSGRGDHWGALPDSSPLTNGTSLAVAAGAHGLVALDGADAWFSPDGWAWRSLPEPGDGTVTVDDAVVRGDTIVAVGAEFRDEDGSSQGRILVAKPG